MCSAIKFPSLPERRPGFDIKLTLQKGKVPPFGPIYPLSKAEEDELRRYLKGALEAGIISPTTSPAGSPVLFVKKADGSLRLCVDYRGLNAVTVTDKTALPIIKDMLRRTIGANYFSKIDLKSAFNLLRIAAGDEYLTAFRTKYGHFEYKVMPFGLKNAPGTFQAFLNHVFGDLIDRGVLGYIDDLLIYSRTKEEHVKLVFEVFNRLRKFGLKANPKKCVFLVSSVTFLGHVISREGLRMDPAKLSSITSWETPSDLKDLQSFLGLANYYRDFIPNFSKIVTPLTALMRKDSPWNFHEEHQLAFEELKKVFASNVILKQPDRDAQFFVECDASDFALGSVLQQEDVSTGRLRPIAFFSRKFTTPELNYEIYDKELMAIVESFKEWRYLLIGTDLPVIVYSDHKNLEYFKTARLLNRRQARWSQYLADFNFQISYRPGKEQVVSDALSRRAAHRLTPNDVQTNSQVVLPPSLFQSRVDLMAIANDSDSDYDLDAYQDVDDASSSTSESDLDDEQMELNWEAGMWNPENPDPTWFQALLAFYVWGELPLVYHPSTLNKVLHQQRYFVMKNHRLHKKVKVNSVAYTVPYVPVINRLDLLKRYHITLGHMAANTLFPVLYSKYFWQTMKQDCVKIISQCDVCQLHAQDRNQHQRPLFPHEPVGIPFQKWGIDFLQDLPESSNGLRNIITAVDYATKYVVAKPLEKRDAGSVASFIFENITCRFGVPVEIVTDRAKSFLDSVLQEYLKLLEIHHLPTTPYTPKSNGMCERMHRSLNAILTKLCAGDRRRWSFYLPQAVFALNVRRSNATGFSPYYLCHGFEPRIPGDALPHIPPNAFDLDDELDVAEITSQELARLNQNRGAALKRLQVQAAEMKRRYDLNLRIGQPFAIGDIVKLKNHRQTKFQFPWLGPFYVVAHGPNGTLYLMKPNGQRLDYLVNQDYVAPYSISDPEYYYSGTDDPLEQIR